jgi:hypothetical protein
MSKRTLTDELQSVLLAHSFDAPEPSTSIDRVLARTVDAERPADTNRRGWWPPSTKLLGIAAAVALVSLGAVGVKALSDHTTTTSTADSKAAAPAVGSVGGASGENVPDAAAPNGPRCSLQDLDITVAKGASGSAVIRFVNKTSKNCSIQGYPSVSAQRGQTRTYAMSAAAAKPGGPSSIPPLASPTVVLLPAGTASALLDVIKADSCPEADTLTISLPADRSTFGLPFAIPMCGLQIHAVVPGATGSN